MASSIPTRALLRRVLRPIFAFVTVAIGGIVGFVVLADVGIVDAAFWLIDPTSVELHFETHSGAEKKSKAFSIAVRAGLVITGLWIGETAVTAAFGGQVTEELKRMNTKRQIEQLSDHVVVCGYGMFGWTVATNLSETGHDTVIIERDASEFEAIDQDELAIQGDARKESVLQQANLSAADVVVCAIDDSNVNIQIAITASQIAPDLEVIVRVGDQMYESVALRAGADEVVIPEVLSGEAVGDRL